MTTDSPARACACSVFSHPELAAMVPEFVPVNNTEQVSMELADPEAAKGESMATDGR